MFFLPRYPWGHCVQVTQSAWRIIGWGGIRHRGGVGDQPGAERVVGDAGGRHGDGRGRHGAVRNASRRRGRGRRRRSGWVRSDGTGGEARESTREVRGGGREPRGEHRDARPRVARRTTTTDEQSFATWNTTCAQSTAATMNEHSSSSPVPPHTRARDEWVAHSPRHLDARDAVDGDLSSFVSSGTPRLRARVSLTARSAAGGLSRSRVAGGYAARRPATRGSNAHSPPTPPHPSLSSGPQKAPRRPIAPSRTTPPRVIPTSRGPSTTTTPPTFRVPRSRGGALRPVGPPNPHPRPRVHVPAPQPHLQRRLLLHRHPRRPRRAKPRDSSIHPRPSRGGTPAPHGGFRAAHDASPRHARGTRQGQRTRATG